MPVYGLTDEGFFLKTFEEIIADMRSDLREAFGASTDDSYDKVEGVTMAIVSDACAKLWELAERVYNSQHKAGATGAALASIGLLTNTLWQGATRSSVSLLLAGLAGSSIAAGSIVSAESNGARFETTEPGLLSATTGWLAGTAYVLGSVVQNAPAGGGAAHVYVAVAAGVSDALGTGPTSTDPNEDIVDGTVTWRLAGEGDAHDLVAALAVETGPVVGRAGDIHVIETPSGGWLGATNPLDASVGSDKWTAPQMRMAIDDDIAKPGKSPIRSIRANLRQITGVTAVTVFSNPYDFTDTNGIPPHSVEALIEGGDDQDIFDKLLDVVGGGIRTYGTTTGFANDPEGTPVAQAFSRVVEVPVYVKITLQKNGGEYPIDGDQQVKDKIVEWGNAQRAGRNIDPTAISAQAFKVDGVLRTTQTLADIINPPVAFGTTTMSIRERAVYDTSRITVVSSNGDI